MNIITGLLTLLVYFPLCCIATNLPIAVVKDDNYNTETEKVNTIIQMMLVSIFITGIMCYLALIGWGISTIYLILFLVCYFCCLGIYVVKRYNIHIKQQEMLTYTPPPPPVQSFGSCTQIDEPQGVFKA